MHPTSFVLAPRRLRVWLAAVVFAFLGTAHAYDGFTVGLSGGPARGGAHVVNARAVLPLAEATVRGTSLQVSVRADVASALSFAAPPALGVGAVASATEDGIERYLGVGGGVGMPAAWGAQALWSAYGLAGYRVPIGGGLHGALELQLTGSPLFHGPQLRLALEYTFGGGR